jgi:hypothetical protein
MSLGIYTKGMASAAVAASAGKAALLLLELQMLLAWLLLADLLFLHCPKRTM